LDQIIIVWHAFVAYLVFKFKIFYIMNIKLNVPVLQISFWQDCIEPSKSIGNNDVYLDLLMI